jgi:peptidoglycan-N-acetylglucosamine deacetylase
MRFVIALTLMLIGIPLLPAPPVPENHRELYIRHGRRSSNLVALTYDDGPHHERTPELVALLQELDCPATFFLLGDSVDRNPITTRRLIEAGFEIGNHSMTHARLRRLSRDEIGQEIDGLEALIAEAGGVPSRVFRPPYGISESNRAVVEEAYGERGMEIVLWTGDTEDWRRETTVEQVVDSVLSNVQGGDIILMHDIHSKAVPATRIIVEELRARGFEFVTASEMIEDLRNPPPEPASPEATVSASM